MVSRLSEKNKYGGYTYIIEIEPLFLIYINGSDRDAFIVEFKEHQVLWKSTRLSFVSNDDLITTMHEAYDRIFEWFYNHKSLVWTEEQCIRSRQRAADGLHQYLNNA